MSAPIARGTRFGAALALAFTFGAAAGADAEADVGGELAGLRLFVSPERRAALDGRAVEEAPASSGYSPTPSNEAVDAGANDDSGAMETDTALRGRTAPRPGSPSPGSATLRSAHGTSRIVDGVPLREGPS